MENLNKTFVKFKDDGSLRCKEVSNVGNTLDMLHKVLSEDGSVWCKIFYHNSNNGTVYFTDEKEFLDCDEEYKFSKFYILDTLRSVDNKFEFLLCYPDDDKEKYNRWIQDNNPYNEYKLNGESASGYTEIHKNYVNNNFCGLTRSVDNDSIPNITFLRGSTLNGNNSYSIGALQKYGNGIQSSSDVNNTSSSNIVELWVRVDNLKNVENVKLFYSSVACFDIEEI